MPRVAKNQPDTKLIRVYDKLAGKLSDVAKLRKCSVAELVDALDLWRLVLAEEVRLLDAQVRRRDEAKKELDSLTPPKKGGGK